MFTMYAHFKKKVVILYVVFTGNEGYYLDKMKSVCEKCHRNCKDCTGSGVEMCGTCVSSLVKIDNICMKDKECIDNPRHFYDNNSCINNKCPENC